MKKSIAYMLSLATVMALSGACDVDLHETEICTYTVQLRYDYNEEDTSYQNRILYWVDTVEEYIFDEAQLLYSVRQVTQEKCIEYMDSEMQLEAGKYTVMAIGNRDDRSRVYDQATGQAPVIGETLRADMRMSLDGSEIRLDDGTSGPCEELFYGYRTFSVREMGASRVRVDMLNAHFQLRFRLTWRPGTGTGAGGYLPGEYYCIMREVPSEYDMMPEWIFPAGRFTAEEFDTTAHDAYPYIDNNVIHHIPYTTYLDKNVLSYSNTTYLNADREVWGEIISYRTKNDTGLTLEVYRSNDGKTHTPETDQLVLPRPINLSGYFEWFEIDLDHELKQEYELDIVVDGDRITISPRGGLSISDWTEGGAI
jgi:hypothetical protein